MTQAADMCERLLLRIRRQFYAGDDKGFFQHRRDLLRAITCPASWMQAKAIFLPSDRYESVIVNQIQEIKLHGTTGRIKHFPGYLESCLKAHFQHNAETYYNEGKALRTILDQALTKALSKTKTDPARAAETQIKALASAHQDILSAGRPRKTQKKKPSQNNQPELF